MQGCGPSMTDIFYTLVCKITNKSEIQKNPTNLVFYCEGFQTVWSGAAAAADGATITRIKSGYVSFLHISDVFFLYLLKVKSLSADKQSTESDLLSEHGSVCDVLSE